MDIRGGVTSDFLIRKGSDGPLGEYRAMLKTMETTVRFQGLGPKP